MKLNLSSIIVRSAEAALKLQRGDGSMPAGHNGPYNDAETPVRNTSHWLITFLKAHEISQASVFEAAAKKALDYLMSKEARPMNAVFWHRKNKNKDFSNGLMGQAWTLESLLWAYEHWKDEHILSLAEEVFLKHPYDPVRNAWKTVNVDGSIFGYDVTFNHQLWFSAVGTHIAKYGNQIIQTQTDNFNQAIHLNMECYPDGVIKHIPIDYLSFSRKLKFKAKLKAFKFEKDYMYYKSVGYHGFNLYALALLYICAENLPIYQSLKFKKFIDVIDTESFSEALNKSKYGYPYNPPGLELGFALQVFDAKHKVESWLEKQFRETLDADTYLMNLHQKDDPHTSAARIYEACRMHSYDLIIT